MIKDGYCRYGEACHFYHNDHERRNLIDTLPDLPDGVSLPPMPQWIKNKKQTKCNHYYSTIALDSQSTETASSESKEISDQISDEFNTPI